MIWIIQEKQMKMKNGSLVYIVEITLKVLIFVCTELWKFQVDREIQYPRNTNFGCANREM